MRPIEDASAATPLEAEKETASDVPALAAPAGTTLAEKSPPPRERSRTRRLSLKPLLALLGMLVLLGFLFTPARLPVPRNRIWGDWEIRSVGDSLVRRWCFEPDGTTRYETLEIAGGKWPSNSYQLTSTRRGRYRFLDDYTLEIEWSHGESELWSYSVLPWNALVMTGPAGVDEVYQPALKEPKRAPPGRR